MRINELAARFRANRCGKAGNAAVIVTERASVRYKLHSTTVARKEYDNDSGLYRLCMVNWGNWFTATTARHLSNILDRPVSYSQWRDSGSTRTLRLNEAYTQVCWDAKERAISVAAMPTGVDVEHLVAKVRAGATLVPTREVPWAKLVMAKADSNVSGFFAALRDAGIRPPGKPERCRRAVIHPMY